MPSKLDITRRDFLGGTALALSGAALSPMELLAASRAKQPGYYPPALTGLRGSHPGSFEVAHELAWAGKRPAIPKQQTDADYDLVVVGGGISGLAAAFFYQQRSEADVQILVLDNHDDFGGHAKRNEFNVDGQHLVGYGGSQSLEAPGSYSAVSKKLLRDIAIDPQRFYRYYDQEFFEKRGLGAGLHFPAASYGRDVLVANPFETFASDGVDDLAAVVAQFPISEAGKAAVIELYAEHPDPLPKLSRRKKIAYLQKISYVDYLQQHLGTPLEVTRIFRDVPRGIMGVGWEATSALEAYRWGLPGFDSLNLGALEYNWADSDEPYIFHFPDGNAGVTRALVHKLVPDALPGDSMEAQVLAQLDYGALDRPGAPTRIRLNSTAVDIRHTPDQSAVEVTYANGGNSYKVRGKHVVYAGYHALLPSVCEGLPGDQVAAIKSVTKVPLVYINVALRNWKAFNELGIYHVDVAQPPLMHSFGMDFPVSMGGYQYTRSPEQPVVVHGTYVPAVPESGLSPIDQHRLGRRQLYEMSFADFEEKIIEQMSGALGGGGFDAERDIAAITVNRWPHGYAYEYSELFDDLDFGPDYGPHLTARRQLGRISIANSDASAYAYVDGAIDAADRAVDEQLKL